MQNVFWDAWDAQCIMYIVGREKVTANDELGLAPKLDFSNSINFLFFSNSESHFRLLLKSNRLLIYFAPAETKKNLKNS